MNAPYRRYDAIRAIAADFHTQHWPTRDIPVPIELIVERDLNLQIIPIPGLREQFGVDGFLTSDCTSVYVDNALFAPRYICRYNFTLAHEAGHLTMHRDVYQQERNFDLQGWVSFLEEVNAEPWFDRQANDFAGLVLVPGCHLGHERFEPAIRSPAIIASVDEALKVGLSDTAICEQVSVLVCRRVAPHFRVSHDTVRIRLEREERWPVVMLDDTGALLLR